MPLVIIMVDVTLKYDLDGTPKETNYTNVNPIPLLISNKITIDFPESTTNYDTLEADMAGDNGVVTNLEVDCDTMGAVRNYSSLYMGSLLYTHILNESLVKFFKMTITFEYQA